jgi:hypothetical protein
VVKWRDAAAILTVGKDIPAVHLGVEVSESTYERWKNQYGWLMAACCLRWVPVTKHSNAMMAAQTSTPDPHVSDDQKANWMATVTGESYLAIIRLFGPTEAAIETSWKAGDFQQIKSTSDRGQSCARVMSISLPFLRSICVGEVLEASATHYVLVGQNLPLLFRFLSRPLDAMAVSRPDSFSRAPS